MSGKDTRIDHHRLVKVLERWSFLMTYFVGIDIAKHSHVACVLDQFGEVHIQAFEFSNDLSGFKSLITTLSSFPKEDTIIGFESTAHYHENLFYFLNHNHNYRCELINPLVSSRFRSLSIRDIKTDKVDALSIASFLSFNSSKVGRDTFIINELKYLCDDRHELIKIKSKLYTQLTAALDRVFPELKPFLKNNLKSNIAHNLLKNFSTASEIEKVRVDKLYNVVSPNTRQFSKERAKDLKQLAQMSIGFHSNSLSKRIKNFIHQIELIESQIDDVQHSIIEHMQALDSPIIQLPGMGYIQAAYILSVIQNIQRFDSACKVVAFAGLDPKIRQSGQFEAKKTRMSKRGNKLLRYALIWSANNIRKNSKTLGTYYNKKRSEGKSHYNALGHCATKLVNYIFFILNNPEKAFILE